MAATLNLAHLHYHRRRGGEGGMQREQLRPKFLPVNNFLPKIPNLGLEMPRFAEFKGNIEILSTHNSIFRKFAAVCRAN